MAVDRAQTGPEDVRSPAATDLADKVTAVPVRRTISLTGTLLLTSAAIASRRPDAAGSPDIATFPQRSGGVD